MEILFAAIAIAALIAAWTVGNKTETPRHSSARDRPSMPQQPDPRIFQGDSEGDRRLARIERKLDLILQYLEIEDREVEERDSIENANELFDVVLENVPNEYMISTIKAVRMLTNMDLKSAKNCVESTPHLIMVQVPFAQAQAARQQLGEAGARVRVK